MYGVTGKEEEPLIYRRSAIKVSPVISHLPLYSLERLRSPSSTPARHLT